jgi:hypothetical protein
MSEVPSTPGRQGSEEIDPGAPIEELATFEHEASSDFPLRIRRVIQRRSAVSHLASFSWNAPLLILFEFWAVLLDALSPKAIRKDQRR